MVSLHIHLFDGGRVIVGNGREQGLHSKSGELFTYLVLYRHQSHSRDRLTTLFWGEMEEKKARRCLSTALWRLKNFLTSNDDVYPEPLLVNEDKVQFNYHQGCWLDIAEFEECVLPVLAKPLTELQSKEVKELEKGITLYRNDFLATIYHDWALREREKLRDYYLRSLTHLMRYYQAQKKYKGAIFYGLKLLDKDPLREDIHREIIRLYVDAGLRSKAIQQYQKCRKILARELKILPMEETQKLYQSLTQQDGWVRPSLDKVEIIEKALAHVGLAEEEITKVKLYLNQSLNELRQEHQDI